MRWGSFTRADTLLVFEFEDDMSVSLNRHSRPYVRRPLLQPLILTFSHSNESPSERVLSVQTPVLKMDKRQERGFRVFERVCVGRRVPQRMYMLLVILSEGLSSPRQN